MEDVAFIFASFFIMANRIQILGDRLDKNITTKEWLFLASLLKEANPPGVSEISQKLGYSRQNAKRIAKSLEKKGLISIYKDDKDSRIQRIKFIDEKAYVLNERDEKERDFLNSLFNNLDMNDLKILREKFEIIQENIFKMEE